jgi:hypothetical protein
MHFGHRQVQLPRNQRHRILRHMAQRFLHGVQNLQQRPRQAL